MSVATMLARKMRRLKPVTDRSATVPTDIMPASVMPVHGSEFAPEDAVADGRIEQHQREDPKTLAPEHEGESGRRRRGRIDRDLKRNHVGPERECERAEGRNEHQRNHVEWPIVVVVKDAARKHDGGDNADRREDEQIRPVDPSMHDRKVVAERVDKDNDQESQYSGCKYRKLATRHLTDLRSALPDQPAGAEKCVAKAKSGAAQY